MLRLSLSIALLLAASLFALPIEVSKHEAVGVADEHILNRYQVGSFVVEYKTQDRVEGKDRASSVFVYHSDSPSKIEWETVDTANFVSVAYGVETVEEYAGHYKITDSVTRACFGSSIQSFNSDGRTVTVSGKLRDCAVTFTLKFTSVSRNQLEFDLQVTTSEDWNRVYLNTKTDPTEAYFGFGEQFTFFNYKGKKVEILVQEQGVGRGIQPLTKYLNTYKNNTGGNYQTTYSPVPHYVTSKVTSAFLYSNSYAVFDLTNDNQISLKMFARRIAGRIVHAQNGTPLDIISEYTTYCGRMPLLADWINDGAVLGMQGGTQEVLDTYKLLTSYNVPTAAFWLQDWVGIRITDFGSRLWWTWELDDQQYPNWDSLVDDLLRNGVRMMTYINPFLTDGSAKPGIQKNFFKEGVDNGYFIKNRQGEPILLDQGGFSAGLVDFTNPDARTWYKGIIKSEMLAPGVRGWMADFGESVPWYDSVLFNGEDPKEYHNKYPQEWALVNQEAIAEAGQSGDIVYFMRAAYTLSPGRTTLFWLGDQLVTWDEFDGLKSAIVGMLSSGLSGFSLQHSDIGGYTGLNTATPIGNLTYIRTKELFLRWCELSAFTTVYRTHEGNLRTQHWQFDGDEESIRLFGRMAGVYASWKFYRVQLTREATSLGFPVVRHLFLHYPSDQNVYNLRFQYLIGTELLFAPCADEGSSSVELYLPAGQWVHVWTQAVYGNASNGVTITVPAPLGYPPVFYKQNSQVGAQFVAELKARGLYEGFPSITIQ
eukprot:TRINITY_DN5998_c0_g3_i1.p1 TRINITY_DN5998_c0_g3~~TRINITY_DN5998_c0_g3_i1.p1  ORF type:complete len:764 (-),score=160.62 TRINITY_DN5998_c0_g3_i1:182-2473(-)